MENQIRIVVLDYYMTPPIPGLDVLYSEFRRSSVYQVPVLRCFGSNGNGKKICIHIHGVFPYLYIPYDGTEDAENFSHQLANTIDKAINISLNQGSSSTQHVYKISLVSGIPMYGYHFRKHQFLKIYVYNPMVVSTVSKLLLNQSILGKIFQPHEAHISFTLQFMIDYNLHGMSNMIIEDVKYRTNSTTMDNHEFLPTEIEKITTCELEADINAQSILNRKEIVSGKLTANPGIAALWEDEKQRRRNKNEDSQLGQFIELKTVDLQPTKTHLIYQEALLKRLALLLQDEQTTTEKIDENVSVYAAETPDDVDIQSASIVDLHTPSSLELSLDDSFLLPTQNSDKSLLSSQSYVNVSMDDAALSFANILRDLEKENIESVEEDSILSQTVIEKAEENNESVEDLDLSMPLTQILTGKKEDSDGSDEDMIVDLNTTLVPQIDGQVDDDHAGEYVPYMTRLRLKMLSKKESSNMTDRSMPLLDFPDIDKPMNTLSPKIKKLKSQFIEKNQNKSPVVIVEKLVGVSIPTDNLKSERDVVSTTSVESSSETNSTLFHTVERKQIEPKKNPRIVRFKSENEVLEDQIRLLDFRVKKISRRNKLRKIKQAMNKREKILSVLKQIPIPKFNIVSGRKWFLDSPKEDTVISHILEQTSNYVDSNLHLIVKEQDDKSFLYYYGGKVMPKIVEIKTQSYKEEIKHIKYEQDSNVSYKESVDCDITVEESFQPTSRISCNDVSGVNELNNFMNSDLKSLPTTKLKLQHQLREAERALETHLHFLRNLWNTINYKNCDNIKNCDNFGDLSGNNIDSNSNSCSFNNSSKVICTKNKSVHLKECYVHIERIDKEQMFPDLCRTKFKKTNDHDFPMKMRKVKNLKSKTLLYISCDGTANSSSSEDESDTVKCMTFIKDVRVAETSNTKDDISGKIRTDEADKTTGTYYHTNTNNTSFNAKDDINNSIHSSDSDMYSDEELDQSFFKAYYHKSVSEKYDRETNYQPKQGCSKVFTPNSLPNSFNRTKVVTKSPSSSLDSIQPSQKCNKGVIVTPKILAPTREQVQLSLDRYKIPHVRHSTPFYGNAEDCTSSVEIGHNVLNVPSKTTAHLKEFDSHNDALNTFRRYFVENTVKLNWNQNNIKKLKLSHCRNGNVKIVPLKKPPSISSVKKWIEENSKPKYLQDSKNKPEPTIVYNPNISEDEMNMSLSLSICTQSESPNESQHQSLRKSVLSTQDHDRSGVIVGVTQSNYTLQKSAENLQVVRSVVQHQYLTTLIMELHIRTRASFKPDPEFDPICSIFYSFLNDAPKESTKTIKGRGVVALRNVPNDIYAVSSSMLNGSAMEYDLDYVDSEESLMITFLKIINVLDPDILAGYEVHMLSWGYLIDRAKFVSINLIPLLGRSKINRFTRFKTKDDDYELETAITGRIVLDVWRLMRHEVALQSYTFESIIYTILRRRVPEHSFRDLTQWWDHPTNLYRHRVVEYYLFRVDAILELFEKLDFINRTSELARLFGIMFYEVLSRGSQFRVESMMLRLAKPLNYIPVSPSTMQRAKMRAPEYIPLVMEPESKMYNDPVIVLDFQSLYPSIIIAYNYCFTTCMGRVECLGKNVPFEFGATQLKISRKATEKLVKRDLINFSPCGVAFVKKKVREGILPRMLKEILDTRLMVKNAMKENADNNVLQKVLHNRQLGLKLIANVTYGYTAANFSGRMCCVEVGDSVVSKGRETLQRAIAMVDNTPDWGARVVYGDTDSLFVMVPGKSRKEAFEVGRKIAEAVSKDNPDPIKLKLEKVYQPCILQTKKRYVGYMYENPEQTEPVYDAKGIETVRRDGCPAVSKMLEKCLRLLFETKNVSLIKNYVLRQFNKIQSGKMSIQDLTFAKEYRGSSGYKQGACVPALELAKKWKLVDRRNEPRSGERVPYVIVNGPPGLPLIRLVRSPWDVLKDCSLKPNTLYYITKVIIPPINRCLSLIGVDLNIWYNQMPRKQTFYLPNSSPCTKTTLSQYFVNKICASCDQPTPDEVCHKCLQEPNLAAFTLLEKLRIWESNYYETNLICHFCTRSLDEITCISLNCPVLYRRIQSHRDLQQCNYLRNLLKNKEIFLEPDFL